jgi:hypothetical protein
MDWDSELLYCKAKLYAQRAHDQPVDSSLFGFWMSLSLELLARSGLSSVHPVLLADPREQDNIHYAFGIVPKRIPKSIPAKALFARCSIFVPSFTDKMSGHCLMVSEWRNSELHSAAAAFENIDNSKWLPSTYEVMEVLLLHLKRDFADFLGEYGAVAVAALRDRRDTIKHEVEEKLAKARTQYQGLSPEGKAEAVRNAGLTDAVRMKESRLSLKSICPACLSAAVIGGETVGRSPVRIDAASGSISREVRVLPNKLRCAVCSLHLSSFQEVREAERGNIYTVEEYEDPIEFFGIDPEEYIDIDDIMRRHADQYAEDIYGYNNE